MPKFRHKPPRLLFPPRLLVPGGMGLVLALSVAGFIHFTQITLYKQAHFAPEAAHPWDGYAAFALFTALVSGAGLLLSLRDPAPMRWRRSRAARILSSRRLAGVLPRRAKRRQGSGTIGRQ